MTAVQPASGPKAGGNTIIALGHGFADASKVTVDGVEAKFTVIRDSRMSIVVPPGNQVGPVNIRVTVGPPTGAIVAADGYTYTSSDPAAASTPNAATVVDPKSSNATAGLGNPEMGAVPAPGLRLLSRAEAASVKSTVLRVPLMGSLRAAKTVRVKVTRPFSFSIGGLPPNEVVSVRARIGGSSAALGADQVSAAGWLKVPAVAVSRLGYVALSLTSSSGKLGYVKVLVVK